MQNSRSIQSGDFVIILSPPLFSANKYIIQKIVNNEIYIYPENNSTAVSKLVLVNGQ